MISVELSKRFKKIVRAAGREAEVSAALKSVVDGFGQPHAHTGLAIGSWANTFTNAAPVWRGGSFLRRTRAC